MNDQPPSDPNSEDDLHVREPSYRGLHDRSNRHTYSYVSSSDLEAGTAPLPTRKWTKPLRDGFVTFFQALARKPWNLTATFNEMADASVALLKLAIIVTVIVAVVVVTILIISVGIYAARKLLSGEGLGG
jgi:hypothetical protein